MSKETIEEKFGTVAEQKGFISPTQFLEALEIQVKENMKEGKHRFIGSILLEEGFITRLQINDVLEAMGETLMEGLL